MALSCEVHTAYLYDRGGVHQIGQLDPITSIKWGRVRDDISSATIVISTPGEACGAFLGMAECGRHEVVIFRGAERVWEGPLSLITFQGTSVTLEAKDVFYYTSRTIIKNEYDNRYPHQGKVLDRVKRIMNAELARKEALDPPVNILPHVQYIYATHGVVDSDTAALTLPWSTSVFDHIDDYAWRGGLDYTVVGRSVLFFDVHMQIGQTPTVTGEDFLGDPVITQYGAQLTTLVAMSDGKGHYGEYGGIDPYYGEWEQVHLAYGETAILNGTAPPTVAEMRSQAERLQKQGRTPPYVVRIPDNTRLNPNGVLQISDLVPGVWVPLSADLPSRNISQMQKLDTMTVSEVAGQGEVITVVLSPAYTDAYVETPTP